MAQIAATIATATHFQVVAEIGGVVRSRTARSSGKTNPDASVQKQFATSQREGLETMSHRFLVASIRWKSEAAVASSLQEREALPSKM